MSLFLVNLTAPSKQFCKVGSKLLTVDFVSKLLTLAILSSTAVNAELVANPVILGIFFSISVILAFKSVF